MNSERLRTTYNIALSQIGEAVLSKLYALGLVKDSDIIDEAALGKVIQGLTLKNGKWSPDKVIPVHVIHREEVEVKNAKVAKEL